MKMIKEIAAIGLVITAIGAGAYYTVAPEKPPYYGENFCDGMEIIAMEIYEAKQDGDKLADIESEMTTRTLKTMNKYDKFVLVFKFVDDMWKMSSYATPREIKRAVNTSC